MKPGSIAAWAIAAVAIPGLAACSGTSSGSSPASPGSSSPSTNPPKQFVSGKTYESCLAYLIPGGGSIQRSSGTTGRPRPTR